MAIRIRRGHYIVYWRDSETGRQREKQFGKGPNGKQDAENFESALGLQRGSMRQRRGGTTVGEAVLLYCQNRRLANSACEKRRIYRLSHFVKMYGNKNLYDFSTSHLDRYVSDRSKTVKNTSINRELGDIKAVLNFAVKRGIILANPVAGYGSLPCDDAIIIPPTDLEISAIYNASPPHLKRFIILCSYVITRPGAVETLSIEWRQVSWSSMVINIVGAAKNSAKQHNRRQAPIQPALMRHLKTWVSEDKKLFTNIDRLSIVHYKGAHILSVQHSWESALNRAGISRRIRPYDLRHRSITSVLDAGGDIQALSDIAGSSPEMIMRRYRHVSREQHRRAADLVSLRLDSDD